MTLQKLVEHIDEIVHYKDEYNGIDGMYRYKSCIIRRNATGLYAVAELQSQENSVIIANIDKVKFQADSKKEGAT